MADLLGEHYFPAMEPKPAFDAERLGFIPTNGSSIGEPFHVVFVRKPMPDFGALEYAYETLALVPMNPVGAGISWWKAAVNIDQGPQQYVEQGIRTNGLWLEAGAFYNQPLTDQYGDPVVDVPTIGVPPQVGYNLPAIGWHDISMMLNNPFPDRRV